MEPITTFASTFVVLPNENIDTDQIIPARFLKTTSRTGLGESLFADWRYGADGSPNPEFVLNRPMARAARVLVAGTNFGCGSSREHAPWALLGYGFQAVISTYFADIFRSNAIKNGLLPVTVEQVVYDELVQVCESSPDTLITIDLVNQSIELPQGRFAHFPIDPFAKYCLLNGVDQLGFLMAEDSAISAYEAAHPARVHI